MLTADILPARGDMALLVTDTGLRLEGLVRQVDPDPDDPAILLRSDTWRRLSTLVEVSILAPAVQPIDPGTLPADLFSAVAARTLDAELEPHDITLALLATEHGICWVNVHTLTPHDFDKHPLVHAEPITPQRVSQALIEFADRLVQVAHYDTLTPARVQEQLTLHLR